MKEVALLLLVVLVACTQEVAPPITFAVAATQCVKRGVGDACGCGCLAPAVCIQGTCLVDHREIGEGCVENGQCAAGFCDQGRCAQQKSPVGQYDCKRVCDDDVRVGCFTSCGFGVS